MNLHYAAGFFDGEGCFGFYLNRTRNDQLVPRVQIVNTNREILEQFQEAFGGSVRPMYRAKANWRPCFMWVATSKTALDFMDAIADYLVVKHDQGALARVYRVARPGSNQAWDPEVKQLFIDQSKWLNWRGTGRPEQSPSEIAAAG